jgi:hypothetical protein
MQLCPNRPWDGSSGFVRYLSCSQVELQADRVFLRRPEPYVRWRSNNLFRGCHSVRPTSPPCC